MPADVREPTLQARHGDAQYGGHVPLGLGTRAGREGDASVEAEVCAIGRYFERVIEWRPRNQREPNAEGLTDRISCPVKLVVTRLDEWREALADPESRTLIVVDCRALDAATVEGALIAAARLAPRSARLLAVLSRHSASRIKPAGWQVVRLRHAGFSPCTLPRPARVVNRFLAAMPVVRRLAPFRLLMLHPNIAEPRGKLPSLSVIVPARNERGNIAALLPRLPELAGTELELIFVEGHSTDGTWEEIQRVVIAYARGGSDHSQSMPPHPGPLPVGEGDRAAPHPVGASRLRVKALQQTGRGKADAVRLGIAHASGDLIAILDADLTTPPESLADFYRAYCEGRGDFINGDRLSLPMERGAMRPLNKLGNRFFARALSHVLETPLADCLCGTKLFARRDYERFVAWRKEFGDRDPFGDFELLFPAAALGLGIVNLPIRYAARTYGKTNIHRFRDGARLLAMTLAGWWFIRAGQRLREDSSGTAGNEESEGRLNATP